jgi:hypothetical protein
MRLAISALLTGLVLTVSPVAASTIAVSSVDSLTTVVSTKKKTNVASPLSFSATDPLAVGSTSPFILGQLTQTSKSFRNKTTTLNLAINGVAGSAPFVLNLIYQFTKGAPSGCGLPGNQCAKAVVITTVLASPISVKSGGFLYTIAADGFVEMLGGKINPFILPAKKNLTKTFLLQGSVSVAQLPPSPVPLPAGGLLLAGALGGIGLIRRRRA